MAQPIDKGPETREQWLGRAIEMMRPEFAAAGAPLPENLAVSCSWPSGNPRTVIGECWVAEASSRGYVEVFISPVLDQVAGIQGMLVTLRHELVHAAGRRGHGKAFKTLAVELGLTGPMTATVASPELLDFINWTLLPQLGKYPHGAITGRGGRAALASPTLHPTGAQERSLFKRGQRQEREAFPRHEQPSCDAGDAYQGAFGVREVTDNKATR
jgi:hypothetical protein